MSRPTLELVDIFRVHGPAWRRVNKGHVSLTQLKVMSALEACRTEALGGHVAAYTQCGHRHVAYNCKNRHCPKCQGPAARDWIAARAEDLLPVEYFHVVFTLPAKISRTAYWNKRAVQGLLFRASAETVATATDPRRLGVRVGMTSVLHTWGSALNHHPHVHMIVTGGGLSPDGARWISCRRGFFLPVRVLSRLLQRMFLDGLSALHRAGKLSFFTELAHLADPAAFASWIAPLRLCAFAQPDMQVRAGHTQGLGHGLHREPPFGCHCASHVRFFERVLSSASFRISTSSVLRPSWRSSSRIRCCATNGPPDRLQRSSPSAELHDCWSHRHPETRPPLLRPASDDANDTSRVRSHAIPARDNGDAGAVLQRLLDDPQLLRGRPSGVGGRHR